MIKNIMLSVISLIVIVFFYLIFDEYLSEVNKKKININRSEFNEDTLINSSELIKLKNDTKNSIEFNSGFNIENKDKIKRNFWELLKTQ